MKLETHIHTSGVSPCAKCTPAEAVSRCVALGYDGMVVTNHFHSDLMPPNMKHGKACWRDRIDFYLSDYHAAREAAPPGFTVILGMELRFAGVNANDYLIYGFDEKFLYANPDFDKLGLAKFSELARANGLLVIQAHPFRKNMTIVDPARLDGMEVHNGHKYHAARNGIARQWAQMHGLIMLSGSDYHGEHTEGTPGGIVLERSVADGIELARAIQAGACKLLP